MNVFFFNPFNGISGNMIIGALLDAGVPFEYLEEKLQSCPLTGYRLIHEKVERGGLMGTFFNVEVVEDQPQRNLETIIKIIKRCKLNATYLELAQSVFYRLAQAESKAHGVPIDKVHFHEVGAVDAIIDVLGTVFGFEYFEINTFYSTSINVGEGTVKCAHGYLPVPTPATLELLRGYPIYSNGTKQELTTPTGAAILSSCVPISHVINIPSLHPDLIGYGAGSYDLGDSPNLLRILIGRKQSVEDQWYM
jgi:pyridinium-3,5-bisthiocarboxylic acid mononucleotide nickel chelatase